MKIKRLTADYFFFFLKGNKKAYVPIARLQSGVNISFISIEAQNNYLLKE